MQLFCVSQIVLSKIRTTLLGSSQYKTIKKLHDTGKAALNPVPPVPEEIRLAREKIATIVNRSQTISNS
jgi:hypothetical protein